MRAVGSSTVYPFAKAVAERVARANPKLGTPIIELTGTGAGIKLFCAGVGERFPDVANASRRMKASEAKAVRRKRRQADHRNPGRSRRRCAGDGQAHADFRPDHTRNLSARSPRRLRQAEQGKDLEGRQRQASGDPDPRLRPAADERHPRCAGRADHDPAVRNQSGDGRAKKVRREEVQGDLHRLREDGAYIEAGENDNLIVQKLDGKYRHARDLRLQLPRRECFAAEGHFDQRCRSPPTQTISSFKYPGARPLYIYVKNAHAKAIPAVRAFVAEFTKESADRAEGLFVAARAGCRAQQQCAPRARWPPATWRRSTSPA